MKISFEKMGGESEDIWTFKPHINLTDFGGFFGPLKVFLKFFRNGTVQSVLYYKEGEARDKGRIGVYTSEEVDIKEEMEFKKFQIESFKLCKNKYSDPISVELYGASFSGDHTFMGKAILKINEIEKSEKFFWYLKNDKGKKIGALTFD